MATLPIEVSINASAHLTLIQPYGWTVWETWMWVWERAFTEDLFKPDGAHRAPQVWYGAGPYPCAIRRCITFYDTTGITQDVVVRVWASGEPSPSGQIYILNGNGADPDFGSEIYGWIRGRFSAEYLIASKNIADLVDGKYHYLLIPSAHINSEGYTVLLWVHSSDYNCTGTPTGAAGIQYDISTLRESPAGYIWVEGTKLAYVGTDYSKRLKEGTLEGATGKIASQPWVEETKQRYIDSSGNERYIEGTLTGLNGKLPSQISINTKSPMLGTHYCYIDSSGNERCFEGTAS